MRSWNVRFWRRLGNPKVLYPCKALNYPCNIPHQLVIGGLMFPYDKYLNLNALISPILHGYRNKRTWGKEKRGDIFSSFDTRLAARRPRCEVRRSAVPSGFPPSPVNPRQHLVHSDRAFREETRPNGTDFFPARRRLPQVSRSASSRCCSPRCSPRRTRRSRRTPAHTTTRPIYPPHRPSPRRSRRSSTSSTAPRPASTAQRPSTSTGTPPTRGT